MKTNYLMLIFLLVLTSKNFSQQTQSFREKSFLKYYSDNQYSDGYNHKLLMQNKNKVAEISLAYYTIGENGDTTKFFKVDSVASDKGVVFRKKLSDGKLYGDFKQVKNKLQFFPWPYVSESLSDTSKARNKFFSDYDFYIEIPERTVISIPYRAWHFGALTLPFKIYLASQVQPINTAVFDANINFMIGKKWGKNRYYFLPNEEEGKNYEKSCSLNFILGVGKLELDSTNTAPKTDGKTTLPIFSTGLAFGVHYKKVGVYVATGIDSPIGNQASKWHFAQMPWIGFGLGLGIN